LDFNSCNFTSIFPFESELPSVFSSYGFTATYTGPTSLESNLASRKFEHNTQEELGCTYRPLP
jgi:hypothetical protein